jgi:hypothetical protein
LPGESDDYFDDGHLKEGRKLLGHMMPMLRGHGFLWHCTGPGAFYSIMRDGAIGPSSDVPAAWQSSMGRRLGAVCLFDFDSRPEHCAYYSGATADVGNWFGWSLQHVASVCIAIERAKLDPSKVLDVEGACAAISPEKRWDYKQMGELECWHVGPLPVAAFTRLYIAKSGTLDHVEIPLDGREVETVRGLVAPWEEERARPYVPGPDEIDFGKIMAEVDRRRSGAGLPDAEEGLPPEPGQQDVDAEIREARKRVWGSERERSDKPKG